MNHKANSICCAADLTMKQLYTGLACVSTCEIDGEKGKKCKKTMNEVSIYERFPTFGKETLPVG